MCICGVCSHPWSACEIFSVPYVDAGVGDSGGVVVVSAGLECVGGTCGSGIMTSMMQGM